MTFWERLDKEIETRSSRKALTSDLGLASNAISLWMKRKTFPAIDVMVNLARKLGTTCEYLYDGEQGKIIGDSEFALLSRARRWAGVLDDLEVLSDDSQRAFVLAIHTTADEARAKKGNIVAG